MLNNINTAELCSRIITVALFVDFYIEMCIAEHKHKGPNIT